MSVVGATSGLAQTLGFEEGTRGALKVLIDGLNDEIGLRSSMWAAADLEWQEFAGLGIGQVDVQPVELGNFHEGPHRSIVEAPISDFPAVCAWSYFTRATGGGLDGAERTGLRLAVETFCASGPVTDDSLMSHETIAHRRIQRTTEAVNSVLMRNRSLCGAVQPGIVESPSGGPTNQSFIRKEESGSGPRHLWQGSRLEYTLQRNSTF